MTQDSFKDGAQRRENPDPHEKNRPVPRLIIAIVSLLLIWSVSYILLSHPSDDASLGDSRTMATLTGKPGAKPGGAVDGAQIYAAQCIACHQATGAGLPGVFPPLAGSEWVLAKDTVTPSIVLHGITGKLTVKGTAYNGAMPSFKDKLNDAEIAAVLSYVRSNFGNSADKISADTVKTVRDGSKDRTQPWNGDDELAKLKE